MKINWHEHPFLRIFIAFALGILCDACLPFKLKYSIFLGITACLSFFIVNKKIKNYSYRWISGLILMLIIFCLGAVSHHLQLSKNRPTFAENFLLTNSQVLLQVDEAPVEKEKTIKLVTELIGVEQNQLWKETCGKTIVYIKKNSLSKTISYGDVLLTNALITKTNKPLDPYEYNYKNYLENNNIYFQSYISDNSKWSFYQKDKGNRIKKWALLIRDYFLSVLRENNISATNFAVASALVIGYEDKLSNDTYTLFSEAGVLHILSVSGLHVAIIFYVFSAMFQFLEKLKRGKFIKGIVLLFSLWFYASVTGLSPSVMRSASMFSLVVVAQLLKQRASIFNSMSASAVILLLINPLTLFDIGFQLSYLAVLGIVTFNPLFTKIYDPSTWLLKQVWAIISVSVSAQLVTLPISLYYFNQFPTYFLFANLLIIPLSTIILYLGLAMALLGKIAIIIKPIAWLFNQFVSLLLYCSERITKFPNASIQHIYFSFLDMICVYFAIGFLLLFFYARKGKFLVVSLCFLLAFSISAVIEKKGVLSTPLLQVHALKKAATYSFSSNQNLVLLADSNFVKNTFSKKWLSSLITKTNTIQLDTVIFGLKNKIDLPYFKLQHNMIFAPNKSGYFINGYTKNYRHRSKLDFVIISNMPMRSLKTIALNLMCKRVILDGSMPLYKATEIVNMLQKRNIGVSYVMQSKTIRL